MILDTDRPRDGWIITAVIALLVAASFFAGVFSTSHSYNDRYPMEYNWWVDHEQLHYPGVLVSSPTFVNTSCRQDGNVRPPYGDNITQIQWVGGWDSGFVANLKIVYEGKELIIPAPSLGKCVYIQNATGKIIVYGQDTASGGWTKLGSGNSSIISS